MCSWEPCGGQWQSLSSLMPWAGPALDNTLKRLLIRKRMGYEQPERCIHGLPGQTNTNLSCAQCNARDTPIHSI